MKAVVEFLFSIIINSGAAQRPAVRKLRQLGHLLLALGLALVPVAGTAGNLNLSNAPLFLGATVEPNITFVNDDSGSMDWQIMVVQGGQGTMILDGTQFSGDQNHRYVHVFCQADGTNCTLSGSTWDNSGNYNSHEILPDVDTLVAHPNHLADVYGVWRGRFSGYNAMYYNPEVTYTPWTGVNELGAAYVSANPLAAPLDPYLTPTNPNYRETNLTANMSWTSYRVPNSLSAGRQDIAVTSYYPARYYLWTDTDTNNQVDANDAHVRIEIRVANEPFVHTSGNRKDCLDPLACTYAEEIQNFANWFSYYSRREHAAKNAIGKFAGGAINMRLAYATLHNNSGSNNIGVASMNIDPTIGNKRTLLDGVYKTQSTGGTPLRQTLRDTGRYYECVTGNIFGASGSSCPILPLSAGGACQQNFTVLMTDGFWNGTNPAVANTDGPDPGDTAFDGDPYADIFSNTLADVAMHYYERDLSALPNQVPITPGIDDADHQHMVSYTVAFGLEGTLDPFDTATPGIPSDSDPTDPSFVGWPSPSSNSSTTLDDMWHAAYNGRGEYLSANNPTELNRQLADALTSIVDRTGSASAVALNSGTLSTNSRVYQARFDSGDWSGQLLSIQINPNGTLGANLWEAGDLLKTQPTRQIITYNNGLNAGAPFQWSNIDSAQRLELDKDPGTGSADGLGSQRLAFLRGDHSNEVVNGGSFRNRPNNFVLGDIVSSGPVFVGAPPFAYPESLNPNYVAFKNVNAGRTEMVYVGANDGMLHGFDAITGEEKIAYVPGYVYPELRELTDTNYSHRYFVDGTPTVADVYYGAWHTVLVSGMQAGGQGLFALDVTDPSGFTETNAAALALWEFTDADDADLGYTFGKPAILKMKNGKWAVVFGNGYNNTENDGIASTTGNAVLYIAFIEDGLDGTWTPTSDFIKIDTGRGTATSADGSTPNGLGGPALVDYDGDFVADYIYAGDFQGNLWKFDVTDSTPTNWFVINSGTPTPLFTATDAGGVPQPITVRPAVSNHPDGENGFMVYFGTGKYIETGDNTSIGAQVNTFYGIWDKEGTTPGTHTAVNKSELQTQTLTEIAGPPDLRTITDNPITIWGNGAGEHMGWKVDLPATAEKNVTNPVLIGERVLFTTLIPDDTPCGFGGTGFVMELNYQNGGPPAGPVFDVNDDGVIDSSDNNGGDVVVGFNPDIGMLPDPAILHPGSTTSGELMQKVFSGSSGAISTVANDPVVPPFRRRSWRQLQ
jgi:type IV pilus assembly protein PilY1